MDAFALFPTPVFVHRLDEPDLMADLTREVLALREASDGVTASNGGGAWHSVPDLALRRTGPWPRAMQLAVHGARQAFDAVAGAQGIDTRGPQLGAEVQAWAMVMEAGGYSIVHEHQGSGWSSVLYADAGDDPTASGGHLAFLDARRVPARQAGVELFPGVFTVRPETGMLVIFPAWLQHFVHPYAGHRPRVCLSVNVTLQPPRRPSA